MPGEKLAKITVRIVLSHNDNVRGNQTNYWTFTLGSQVIKIYRGGNPDQFTVPDPDQVGEGYGLTAVGNALALLGGIIFARGLPYTVSTPKQVGTTTTYPSYGDDNPQAPIIEFSITATAYGNDVNLGFDGNYNDRLFPNAWQIVENVLNISPVFATATVTNTGIYGSADGAITIVASGGSAPPPGSFLFTWSDGVRSQTRTKLKAGQYDCVVRDLSTLAYTTVSAVVTSDDRLDVAVQRTGRDVTLVISGGVGPYAILWADGSTDAVRKNLPPGTYLATVTDAHGATATVTVTIADFDVFYFSRNPVTLELQAKDPATKPNLRFLCEVWVEIVYLSGNFVNVAGVLTQPADATGATVFDVSTLLDDYVRPDFPVHGETGLVQAGPTFCRFYLQHSEQWDGGGAPIYTVRDTHYLVYGGLDFFEYSTQNYFKVYRPSVHPFLSWEPAQKEVFADQPEYLYYHHDNPLEDAFTLVVKLYYANGTTQTATLASAAGVQRFEVWRAAVGLAQLRATLGTVLVSAQVVAWDVYATSSTGALLTEVRAYQLSEDLPANRRYFLYANSVGGINTLACQGKAKTDVAYTSVLVQRSLQPGYAADAGETFTTGVAGVPTMSCNTGYLAPAQLAAVQDFLLSEEIRFYDADRYRPGSLTPADTVPLSDDDAGLIDLNFSFVLPTQHRYTPTLPTHF